MNPDNEASLLEDYKRLIDLLAVTEKFLEAVPADPGLCKSHKNLMRHLRSQSPEDILKIMGGRRKESKKDSQLFLLDRDLKNISLEEMQQLASNPNVSRKALEQIAVVRFGMTKGGISTLRTKDALIEKLRTLVENERVHDVISRAVDNKSQ